ncbi:MAG: hypothetical protein HZA80_02515 [Candidatus Taylorbacteria bacterium]|nr:hypothetical protein [Candidatus Taylorbacteria bacterium]
MIVAIVIVTGLWISYSKGCKWEGTGCVIREYQILNDTKISYSNEKYGFEFQYPSSWPRPIEKDFGTKISLQFEKGFSILYGTHVTESTGEVRTFDQVISSPHKIIKIDNKEVVRVEDSYKGISVHIAYIKGKDNKILSIEDSSGLISAEDFDEVISSFGFTFK